MTGTAWDDLDAALAAAAGQGHRTRFWLRDDDATEVTPALDRLGAMTRQSGMPVLLAVIPMPATRGLAEWIGAQSHVASCQHGFSHCNHAVAGERACEVGGDRPDRTVLDELGRGRIRMLDLFGARTRPILVPPWNRIRDSLVDALPALGFTTLSTFAPKDRVRGGPPLRLDCDLDIIDWKNGRRGRGAEQLCRRLIDLVIAAAGSGQAIGLLTHHLAHDETAWSFVATFLARMSAHPHVAFTSADSEIDRLAAA